jgi:hypothetical protein
MAIAISAAMIDAPCFGHGTPIHVNVVAGKLTVSNGLMDDRGHADWVFADPDDEEAIFTPVAGNRLRVSLPGFDLTGASGVTQIHLEALSRPDFTRPASPERWLWYADSTTGAVEDLPATLRLDLSSSQGLSPNVGMTQSSMATSATLQVAELPEHQEEHHLVNFLLNDSNAPVGAFGFFARLTSPDAMASDPFLIGLNHGLDAATFQASAKRINAAARLPGDYNGDEDADGADFLVWQRTLGSATELAADGSVNDVVDAADLTVWRENFGRTVPVSTSATQAVPEPNAAALVVGIGVLAAESRKTRRQSRTGCRE